MTGVAASEARAYIDANTMAEINAELAKAHAMGISLVWYRGLWRHTFDHGWVEVDPESMKGIPC